jgi:5'-3' exonuclease
MIETVLIDGDIVAYRCAAATANDTEAIAIWQTTEMMNRIVHETNALSFKCFLSGSDNFRYGIYPDYKANRRDMPKPVHLQVVREHLVLEWKSIVTDGIEADDAMGIEQCLDNANNTMIASIDKDMLMIPGHHYNFVKQESTMVSPLEGLRNFYKQLIMGDRSDNIPGYDGKMRVKVPQFLQPEMEYIDSYMNEWDMFSHVRDMYNNDDKLLLSGQCLWIYRKENDTWTFPLDPKEGVDRSEA